jgi:glycosyl transferase family 25
MPPLYVINLDRDQERMATLDAHLRARGVDFVRVPAVLGKEVPDWEKLVDQKLYAIRNRRPSPRAGEIGCTLSHLKVLEVFLQTNEPWCVVLEDDVELRPDYAEVLQALGEQDDWDLVKLFSFHHGLPIRKRRLGGAHHLVVHLTRTTSSAAYAVNRRGAEALLKSMMPITEQVDHALDRPWETGLRIRGIRPMPVTLSADALTSTIGYADKEGRDNSPMRLLRLFCFRAGKESYRFFHGLAEGFLR